MTGAGAQTGGSVESNEQLVEALRACQKSIGDLRTAFIVVEGCLDKPYPDDPRWSPWTRFVQRPWNAAATASEMARAALKVVDEAARSGRPSHDPLTCKDGHLGCELARDEQLDRGQK